ncbi:unnamed protein product [Leptidea sinapis]|uniref:C2H2-type domain-containing protein n=1 Tax=Leptidea sinapis TaxID=189913 RepID=A0A5E4QRW6_9NEOP|nr:unnamed protein product [Leptidea sinapis]
MIRSESMRVHAAIHTDRDGYTCVICDKRFDIGLKVNCWII